MELDRKIKKAVDSLKKEEEKFEAGETLIRRPPLDWFSLKELKKWCAEKKKRPDRLRR